MIKLPLNKKIKLLIALAVLIVMQLAFFTVTNAQTPTQQTIRDACDESFVSLGGGQFLSPFTICDNAVETGETVDISGLKVSISRNTLPSKIYAKVFDGEGGVIDWQQCVGTNANQLGVAPNGTFQQIIFDDVVTVPALGGDSGLAFFWYKDSSCTVQTSVADDFAWWGASGGVGENQIYREVIFSDQLAGDAAFADLFNFNTRFTGGVVSGASTTVQMSIDYILDTDEYTAENRPDYIQISTLANGFLSDQQVSLDNKIILPLVSGSSTSIVDIDYNFADGSYLSYINFGNINTNSVTFGKTLLILSFDIVAGQVQNSTVEDVYNNLIFNDTAEYAECSISNIGGCITNALIFTFVPTSGAFDRFTGVYEAIDTKPPFGYVTSIKDQLSGIGTSTTQAFQFGDIPFTNQIFDPFKDLMAIGLWVIYSMFLMGRLDKIDI